MKLLLNFADANFRSSQKKNTETGLAIGGFDLALAYSPKDIDSVFAANNQWMLSQSRGAGYWLWKPYFILRTLISMNDGDVLFYADAGSYFVHSTDPLIRTAEQSGQDVLFFENPHLEKHWTKRDALILMGCDQPRYRDSRQRGGGFSLWRKSEFALLFANQYLHYCRDPRIATDIPNQLGFPNHDGFRENRHDQSVASLLCKKHHVPAFRFLDQRGNQCRDRYANSPYPQIVELTRKRDPAPTAR